MNDSNTLDKVKSLLAEHLGIDATDIQDNDSLVSDLHMDPGDLSDFVKTLEDKGINMNKVDLSEIETFEDLTDSIDGSSFSD